MPDIVPSFVMKQNWDLDKVFAIKKEQDALSSLLQSLTGQAQEKDQAQDKDDFVVDFMDL